MKISSQIDNCFILEQQYEVTNEELPLPYCFDCPCEWKWFGLTTRFNLSAATFSNAFCLILTPL